MAETTTRVDDPARQQPSGGWARLPMIPGPWETVVLVWRRLRKMSTALVLLFSLAVASIVATFIPQEPLVPETVARWRTGAEGPGATVARVLDGAQLFDVFSSWWFSALTILLLISLTGCLVPRYRAFARVARRPPAVGHRLERLSTRATLSTTLPPDDALAVVDRTLGRRFRRRRIAAADAPSGRAQVAAERGHWREGGNLLFHTAFYVLLIGVGVAQAFGFTGQINVAEGATFTDTRIVYGNVRAGRWFGIDDHRGFQVRLDDFEASYHDDGVPDDFVSTVTITDGGETAVAGGTVRPNHPLTYDGMKLYQLRFGMAPHVVVRAGDTVLFDDRVMMADVGGGVWTGTAKVKTSQPEQIALDLALLPDFAVDARGRPVSRSPEPDNPVLFADLWVGELGLERPVSASQFIRDGEPVAGATLVPGATTEPLLGNLTVEFVELPLWSGFQVSHAPGRWTMLAGCVLLLIGLVASLYSYRRRVWAEAWQGDDGTTRVLLAGVALQRKVAFADAFAALADTVRTRLEAAEPRVAQETPMTDAHHG